MVGGIGWALGSNELLSRVRVRAWQFDNRNVETIGEGLEVRNAHAGMAVLQWAAGYEKAPAEFEEARKKAQEDLRAHLRFETDELKE